MHVRVFTPPALEPVSLDEARQHLRLDDHADDSYVTGLIAAARETLEQDTRRQLITATLVLTLDDFPSGEDDDPIWLPFPPIQSPITSLIYTNEAGVATPLSASNYVLDAESEPGRLIPAYGLSWPTARDIINAVAVKYLAGYGAAAASVPRPLRQAILLLLGHWYEHREAASDGPDLKNVPAAYDALVAQYRVFSPANLRRECNELSHL